MADYPTGNQLFLETDAAEALTCAVNRDDARDRAMARCRCSLCGTSDGWEDWGREEAGRARDSLLLVFAVRLVTRWGETIMQRLDDCRGWRARAKLAKALREGTACKPLPTFYRRNDDAGHLYTRCPQCQPVVDGAVVVDADEVQRWLEEGEGL